MNTILRKTRCFNVMVWLSMIHFALIIFSPSLLMAAESIKLPAGTIISLATSNEISPETSKMGDRVYLRVVSDVKVKGKVVIAAGASAKAEVTISKTRGSVGSNASIGLTVRSVEAVDGTVVGLYGTKFVEGKSKQTQSIIFTLICCVLFLFQKGDKAIIPAGSYIDSEVASTIDITVE